MQWVAERELIFGLHVHVGLETAQQAIAVANGLRTWLPELLALSANSPFWHGRDTGLALDARRSCSTPSRAAGCRRRSRRFEEFELLVERGVRPAPSTTTPSSGGTCGRTRSSARSRSGSATAQTRLENVGRRSSRSSSRSPRRSPSATSARARCRSSRGRWSRRTSGARRATASTRSSIDLERDEVRPAARGGARAGRAGAAGRAAARLRGRAGRDRASLRRGSGADEQRRASSGATGACSPSRSGSRSRRPPGSRTEVAARGVGYPDLRRTPDGVLFFHADDAQERHRPRGRRSTATGMRFCRPAPLTPVTLYRQPPPPRRGVAGRVGRFFALGGLPPWPWSSSASSAASTSGRTRASPCCGRPRPRASRRRRGSTRRSPPRSRS